jgi:hypothetical protein
MNNVSIEPTLVREIGTPFFLEWQVRHYTNRLAEARRKTGNTQERSFLRRTLHGLRKSLAAKLN